MGGLLSLQELHTLVPFSVMNVMVLCAFKILMAVSGEHVELSLVLE